MFPVDITASHTVKLKPNLVESSFVGRNELVIVVVTFFRPVKWIIGVDGRGSVSDVII
jgi:hypothetical protein